MPRLAVSFLITYLLVTYLLTTDHRTRNARTRAWVASPADSKTVCKSGNPRLAVVVPYPFAVPLALPVARWFISNYGSLSSRGLARDASCAGEWLEAARASPVNSFSGVL